MFKASSKHFNFSGESLDNAFYHQKLNQVQINVGLLKGSGVGFRSESPLAVMYGGLTASTLGHELTHGFDSEAVAIPHSIFSVENGLFPTR